MSYVQLYLLGFSTRGFELGNDLHLEIDTEGVPWQGRLNKNRPRQLQLVYSNSYPEFQDLELRLGVRITEKDRDPDVGKGKAHLALPQSTVNEWQEFSAVFSVKGKGGFQQREEGQEEHLTLHFRAIHVHAVVGVYADAWLPEEEVDFPLTLSSKLKGPAPGYLQSFPGPGLPLAWPGLDLSPALKLGERVAGPPPTRDETGFWYHSLEGDKRHEAEDTFRTGRSARVRMKMVIDLASELKKGAPQARQKGEQRECGPARGHRYVYLPSSEGFYKVTDEIEGVDEGLESSAKVFKKGGAELRFRCRSYLPFLNFSRSALSLLRSAFRAMAEVSGRKIAGSFPDFFHIDFRYTVKLRLFVPTPEEGGKVALQVSMPQIQHDGYPSYSLILTDESACNMFEDQILYHQTAIEPLRLSDPLDFDVKAEDHIFVL